MSKGIVILGCNGQVGRALQEIYPKATALGHQQLDIADEEQVLGYDWSGVDVIINAAAFVNADGSETIEGRAKAWQVNAVGPRNLRRKGWPTILIIHNLGINAHVGQALHRPWEVVPIANHPGDTQHIMARRKANQ